MLCAYFLHFCRPKRVDSVYVCHYTHSFKPDFLECPTYLFLQLKHVQHCDKNVSDHKHSISKYLQLCNLVNLFIKNIKSILSLLDILQLYNP